ncbi:MAG: response regulator [Burkholderiales bacterium]|nr:MAG: response regulator [Burkholderiales bacterium]
MQVRGSRVLVVEDQYLIADEVVRLLKSWGAEVLGPARDIDAAISIVEQSRVDLAVLDINMRGRKIYPAADALRKRGIPFVFVSAYDRSEVRADFHNAVFIGKPFPPQTLRSALEDLAMAP